MVNCCRIDLILIIRQLCYGTPGPDWDIINVEDIVIMINKLLPRSKGHLIDLLWALCDIVNNNKNHVNYLIEYQSLDIICDMLCKNKCIQMMYKPLVSLIAKMAADERIDQIMEITENLLRLVQTGSDKNGARKTSRKAVENRRGFLVDYGICDTIINILEFGLDGYMKIEQLDEDGDIDPEIQKNKYLDIMRNGSEIVYYITRSEHNVGSSISNLMDVLVKVFGRMDDEDLKCDILWTFQNMSNDKRCIQHIINSSIIDYILSILLAFEQNEDKMTDYEHEDNEIQKIMLRACFLIIENVACGTSQQLGIICISDFLKLEFDKFMQLDEKISKNVIYTLRAITNGIYRQCKKYLDGDNYQQNAQDSFLRCFTKSKQEDTTKNAKFITDMIHPTIPYLGKLLSNIEDYDLIENIIWIISYIVIDKDWAKVMSSDHEEDMGYFMINIIHLLKKLSFENDDILRRTVIKHIIRGCFIIIRRIANHSDFLAMELLKFNLFDIDLNVYLVHDDGQLITNTTQAIKALLSRTMDVIDVDIKQKLLNVNDGILSSLMSILYLDDGLKLENGEYYDGNTQIRMECTLDIINLMLINQDSDGFEIAKSIGIAGGLDKLLQIQHSPHFLLNVSMKAKNLRESVMNKFVNFVLNP